MRAHESASMSLGLRKFLIVNARENVCIFYKIRFSLYIFWWSHVDGTSEDYINRVRVCVSLASTFRLSHWREICASFYTSLNGDNISIAVNETLYTLNNDFSFADKLISLSVQKVQALVIVLDGIASRILCSKYKSISITWSFGDE